MGRSHKLKLTDWPAANSALQTRFEGNKSKLADYARLSRTTVTHFFNEKPVSESTCRKLCLALWLIVDEVASVDPSPDSSNSGPFDFIQSDEVFITQLRAYCCQKILAQHSRIRLLSGKEFGVDQLYVDVWLLENPENKNFSTQESLLNNFDIERDRLALSKRIQRNSGLEIANSNHKLVILGKPGSGKTTFLKHLAFDWYEGSFQPEKIAVLIELRRIRRQNEKWRLIEVISQELNLSMKETVSLLEQGKLLLLMDGLD